MNRDIVVVGASAGGLEPLCTIVKHLPRDLPASLFVCVHVGKESMLDEVLQNCGGRCVVQAQDDTVYQPGMVYVAPPRVHLTIGSRKMKLVHTATENRHRPSIDVLFRSAARCCGSRVVGVILSGSLDDGAAGLHSIKARGGATIVQDPNDAAVPDMPRAALRHTHVDHRAAVADIPNLIVEAMKGKALRPNQTGNGGETECCPDDSQLVPFVCPDCDGPIFQCRDGKLVQFRCSVGHKYSPESFTEAHRDALERALWIAMRTLENRGQIHRFLAECAVESGDHEEARTIGETATAARRDMELIREIIDRL